MIFTKHGVVIEIRGENLKDDRLLELSVRILTDTGRIFRTNRIVIPTSLQRKVIKAEHDLGHLGMTKTKQMLREKYRFPTRNSVVEQIIGQCYECQVTAKQHRKQPVIIFIT